MKLHPLSTVIIVCGLLKLDPARTLQIFNGTLTKITCSATMPVFRVMEQGLVYAYDQLPDLFDIEAKFFSAGNNVTLYINGTYHSNNVTVMCGYTNLSSARFQVLFESTLEFISILPAPIGIHYIEFEDSAGYLQILWEPPTLVYDEPGSQNVSIDSRITHYIIIIYITNESTATVYNASETSFTIRIDKIPCSFWFQVAAVNPAGVGEHSPPQNLTFDLHTGCMGSTSSTTVTVINIESIPASSGLSAGEMAAIIVGVVLVIMGLLIILPIAITLKLKNDRHQCAKQDLKPELRSDQLSDAKGSVAEIEKCVESDHKASGNDHDIVDGNQQPDSTPTRTYSHDGPPVCSYLYAEIDVVAKRKNKVPEPSSTEDIDHHVYAVLEQPSNQIQITNTNINDIDQDVDHPKPDS